LPAHSKPSPTAYTRRRIVAGLLAFAVVAAVVGLLAVRGSGSNNSSGGAGQSSSDSSSITAASTTPSRPVNIYRDITSDKVRADIKNDPYRIYVPSGLSNTVTVIDGATGSVLNTFKADEEPQHVVPSWDLKTLWLLNNQGYTVVPIDPKTSQPGTSVKVDDPYNLYFTPDGSDAIVVAEARKRLDFRDPHTMAMRSSLETPTCDGINHSDYSGDFRYAIFTCEFAGRLIKVDMKSRTVVGSLDLSAAPPGSAAPDQTGTTMAGNGDVHSMPQDVRTGPDGKTFFVADMLTAGVHVIDGDSFTETGFIHTGVGAHGINPSRDGTKLYVANRGSTHIGNKPGGPGSVSVIDVATKLVVADWPVPNGGSPDMGNLSPDGRLLWLSGRYDSEVYAFDTVTGAVVHRVPVGDGPHGLVVWPQPGRFSLGHTGNMR